MARPRRVGLSVKIGGLIVLTVLLTASAGAAAAILVGRSVIASQHLERRMASLEEYGAAVGFYLDSARHVLETSSALPELAAAISSSSLDGRNGPPKMERVERDLARIVLVKSKLFESVALLRPNGSIVFLEPAPLERALSHTDLSFQAWYRELRRTGQTVVSDLVISPATQRPTVVIATPVRSADGAIIGILVGALGLSELSRIGQRSGTQMPAAYGYVTDRRGLIIAHQARRHYVEQQTDFSSVPAVQAAREGARGSGRFLNAVEEEEVLGAWMPLGDLGWPVVHVTPVRVAFAPVHRLAQGILLTACGLVLTMGTAGVLIMRRTVDPIRRMTTTAQTLGRGDLSQRIDVRTGDEIEQLANEFNGMAAALERDRAQVRTYAGELERTVEALTQALGNLEAANREIEAFSYSVSHDLRVPLRALTGFSSILLDRHAAHVSDEARRYLLMVADSARQMQRLIDDLLMLSRLGRQTMQVQPVAPVDLVSETLVELKPQLEDRRVDIRIGDLPTCDADPRLLKQVFVNLLDNALKFTRRREDARIEVGCTQIDGVPAYFVQDNGVGFDRRYASKLFGVFQRLHPASQYEGTGVGLAIVARVIHRHGGRVWVESAVDRGATFFFTLGRALHS